MARRPRIIEPEFVYHVYNRRTDRQTLFASARAFDRFVLLLEDARERYDARIVAYCVMETHWHLALWPREKAELSRVLRWLSGTHAIRLRLSEGTRGDGHVYQDRFKSVAVESWDHYLTLVRYIEANPVAAGLVQRAEYWPWSSLADRLVGRRRILSQGPIALPANWLDHVNSVHS